MRAAVPGRVLLATCPALPEGEPGGGLLRRELRRRDVTASWAAWDDPAVDWGSADLVLVRSTWDYQHRRAEFLSWARSVPRLRNPADVLAWNTDKAYLLDLAEAGLPVVPSANAEDSEALAAAVAAYDVAVVKPRVGASGVGIEVVGSAAEVRGQGPWLVQPLVESVHTTGELSVFVLGGTATSEVRKRPAPGAGRDEVRVHEEYGGSTAPVELDIGHAALAEEVVAVAARGLGFRLPYARVDLMEHGGRTCLGELEVTEPGLYLDVVPGNASAFAEAVVGELAGLAALADLEGPAGSRPDPSSRRTGRGTGGAADAASSGP